MSTLAATPLAVAPHDVDLDAATGIKVADEVWIATALLQMENPGRADFSVAEIVDRAAAEAVTEQLRPGVRQHTQQHCVATLPASPNTYRMLTETRPKYRRLFHSGDTVHQDRREGKMTPAAQDLPERYAYLLGWYRTWSKKLDQRAAPEDPLLALYGSGKQLWSDEPADQYVARLREGWD